MSRPSFVVAKVVLKAASPKGKPQESDFKIEERVLPALNENEFMIKSLYISPDPYQRGRMDGEIMTGSCVAEVLETKNPKFRVGDTVVAYKGWVSHAVCGEEDLGQVTHFDTGLGPVSTALGVLGMPGMTAYFGLLRVCQPKAGDVVVVSGAAGAVGSVVGQIAKIKRCTVIGIAGSDEKCNYIKSLGFDHAINYKTCGSIKSALDKITPEGVDCFFDNVGGEALDAVLMSIKPNARIAICGQISEYNNLDNPSTGPRLFYHLIYKNAKVEGFLCWRWKDEWPVALLEMSQWVKDGKIKYRETIDEGGIEAVPRAFISMLSGGNVGKQLVKL